MDPRYVISFEKLGMGDVDKVGGKNASLGEMISHLAKLGVSVPGDTWHTVRQIPLTMPSQRSSTAQDLARRKPSEIDYLNGYIVRKGRELNIQVPVNRALYALVKLIEMKKG